MQTRSDRLRRLRRALGDTQAGMAARLGCSLRAYSDNENGNARTVHVLAAEYIAIHEAWRRGDPGFLPDDLRAHYDRLVALGCLGDEFTVPCGTSGLVVDRRLPGGTP